MGEREKLIAVAAFGLIGVGVLAFYSIRDGIIRRHAKINAFREPLTGNRALALGIVWLIVDAVFLATMIWVIRYALGLPPG